MINPHSTSDSGIYIIRNIHTEKIYIGQARNIQERWQLHQRSLRGNYHHNLHLQHAWNKHGETAFQFLILEYCSIEDLDEREQYYLNIYIPKGKCYNIAVDARSPNRGNKLSEEQKLKMSEARRGKKLPPRTDEHRAKLSAANKLRPAPSAETRQKISDAGKRRPPVSVETRQKLSKALQGRPAPNRGKSMTEEQKQKLSEAAKRRWTRERENSSHSGS